MNYIKFYERWIDNTHKYSSTENIEYWMLEVDDKGSVLREIAIDIKDQVIKIAPFKKNRGLFVDSNVLLNPMDYEPIQVDTFIEKWEKYVASSV